MRKQVYVPYLVFALLGLGIFALLFLPSAKPPTGNIVFTIGTIGIAMVALSINRILYLRAAAAVISTVEPRTVELVPVVLGFGLVYVSIEGLGDYRLDKWHNSFDDNNKSGLANPSIRQGLVYIDPSDNLPVAVNLDQRIFLLEGTPRKRPFSKSFLSQRMQKINPAELNVGHAGWWLLLNLIFVLSGAMAYEFSIAHDNEHVRYALLFIPASIFYFMPFIIGSHKGCKGGDINFALNLFTGWTALGWLYVCYRVWRDIESRKTAQTSIKV